MLSGPEKRGLLLQLLNVLGRILPHLQSAQLAQPRGRLKLTPKKSPEPARCFPSMFLSTNFTYTQLLGSAMQDPKHDAWARPWGEGLPGLCTKEDRDDRELLCAMGLSQMEWRCGYSREPGHAE